MKKGFTLVEIIISIALIMIISTGATLIVLNNKSDESLDEVNRKILEATHVFVEAEVDMDGNDYIEEIYKGRKGLEIPLHTLVNNGYIDEADVNEIYDVKGVPEENKDYYVLLLAGEGEENPEYCSNSDITYTLSWTTETSDGKPLYLCQNNDTNKDDGTILKKIILQDYNTNCSQAGATPSLCYLHGNNLSDDEQDVWYFKGNVTNNYLKFNGLDSKLFRIVRTVEDGSIKIVDDATISCNLYLNIGNAYNGRSSYYTRGDTSGYRWEMDGYKVVSYRTTGHNSTCEVALGAANTSSWDDSTEVTTSADPSSGYCSSGSVRTQQSPIYTYIYKPLKDQYDLISSVLENYIDTNYKWCDVSNNGNGVSRVNFKCSETKNISSNFGMLNSFEYLATGMEKGVEYYNFFDHNIGGSWACDLETGEVVMELKNGLHIVSDYIYNGSSFCTSRHKARIRPAYVIKGNSKVISGDGTKTDPYIIDGLA